jgi:hypothetical protein
MATRTRVAIGVLAIVALAGAILIGGWLGGNDDGPVRPVEWHVDRQLGPKEARLLAPIEYCISEETRFEEPIVDYEGDRAYVELRLAPEDADPSGCFLNLPILNTKLTLERNLDELTLFDSSTDPPEQRWPRERPRPGE